MAITFTGTGGLFTQLGQLFKYVRLVNTHENTTMTATMIPNIAAQYTGVTYLPIYSPIADNVPGSLTGAEEPISILATAAKNTLIQAVQNDTPSQAGSLGSAVANVIYQMQVGSYYVNPVTVGATSAVYPSGGSNTGDGAIVLTTQRGDGLIQQHIVAEVDPIVCTADAQTGGATAGQETFHFIGATDAGNTSSYLWPTGSGGSTSFNAINALSNNSGNNLLTNGSMSSWTGNVLNNWTLEAGVYGTDFTKSTSTTYNQVACLEFIGGGSVLQSFSQLFGNASTGTGATLQADRSISVNFKVSVNSAPAAGIVKVELVSGSASNVLTVVNDDQGNANSFTIAVTGLTSAWTNASGVFRCPRVMPNFLAIRIVATTLISSGHQLYIDWGSSGFVNQLYPGGPSANIHSGITPFVAGDGWYATMTNNRDSATYMSTFSAMFDRFFGMRALGLILPYTGSNNIADTLITA